MASLPPGKLRSIDKTLPACAVKAVAVVPGMATGTMHSAPGDELCFAATPGGSGASEGFFESGVAGDWASIGMSRCGSGAEVVDVIGAVNVIPAAVETGSVIVATMVVTGMVVTGIVVVGIVTVTGMVVAGMVVTGIVDVGIVTVTGMVVTGIVVTGMVVTGIVVVGIVTVTGMVVTGIVVEGIVTVIGMVVTGTVVEGRVKVVVATADATLMDNCSGALVDGGTPEVTTRVPPVNVVPPRTFVDNEIGSSNPTKSLGASGPATLHTIGPRLSAPVQPLTKEVICTPGCGT